LSARAADGSGAVLIDATLGAGGHAERFLREFPGLRLIGLDRDPDALTIAASRLEKFGDRVNLMRNRYDEIAAALAENGLPATDSVDGVLFDLKGIVPRELGALRL
jgi:16S rRNA (cytosine1402-N4)-methyltransferase